mgnify:CR=1 FL=1
MTDACRPPGKCGGRCRGVCESFPVYCRACAAFFCEYEPCFCLACQCPAHPWDKE